MMKPELVPPGARLLLLFLPTLALSTAAGCGDSGEGGGNLGDGDGDAPGDGDAGTGGLGGDGDASGSGGTVPVGPEDCGAACSNDPVGSCSAPEVRVTEVDVGVPVVTSGSETGYKGIHLGAIPHGGFRVAFMSSDDRVHVARLDCADALVGSPFSFGANDFQDVAADAAGGVVVHTKDARGGGTLNCGEPSNLCDGGPADPIPCYEMWMTRFDCAGNEEWSASLTTSSDTLPPYSTGPDGDTALMIWWYQHHGRIAYDGSNYAAYFGVAISVSEGGCINIHQGDRMVVVGPDGNTVDHPDDFGQWGVGCSHSWNTRITWDDAAGKFVMVCGTDNQGRVAQPNPYRTIYEPADLGTLSVGDLVVAEGGGYWVTASDLGTIHLLHFTDGMADQDIELAQSDYSHLVEYGDSYMIASWGSGATMMGQVLSRATGEAVSQPFEIGAEDMIYQPFEKMADGSVAFAAPGSSSTSIRIARVMPCAP